MRKTFLFVAYCHSFLPLLSHPPFSLRVVCMWSFARSTSLHGELYISLARSISSLFLSLSLPTSSLVLRLQSFNLTFLLFHPPTHLILYSSLLSATKSLFFSLSLNYCILYIASPRKDSFSVLGKENHKLTSLFRSLADESVNTFYFRATSGKVN